jgi:hypothetical protein
MLTNTLLSPDLLNLLEVKNLFLKNSNNSKQYLFIVYFEDFLALFLQ